MYKQTIMDIIKYLIAPSLAWGAWITHQSFKVNYLLTRDEYHKGQAKIIKKLKKEVKKLKK